MFRLVLTLFGIGSKIPLGLFLFPCFCLHYFEGELTALPPQCSPRPQHQPSYSHMRMEKFSSVVGDEHAEPPA